MVMLSNSPREQTLLRLEQAKSLTFGLHVTSYNGVPIDLTGATLTFHMAEQSNVPNTPGTILFSKVAEMEDVERGFARFEFQAVELDHKAGEYDFDITYLNASGYSVLLVKGVVQLQLNTDRTASGYTYEDSAIPQDLTVLLRGTGAISVVTGPSVPPEWTDARTAYVNEANHLIFVTGSGALHDAGTVTGPRGPEGPEGPRGQKGDIGDVTPEAQQTLVDTIQARDVAQIAAQTATTASNQAGVSAQAAAQSANAASTASNQADVSAQNAAQFANAASTAAADEADARINASLEPGGVVRIPLDAGDARTMAAANNALRIAEKARDDLTNLPLSIPSIKTCSSGAAANQLVAYMTAALSAAGLPPISANNPVYVSRSDLGGAFYRYDGSGWQGVPPYESAWTTVTGASGTLTTLQAKRVGTLVVTRGKLYAPSNAAIPNGTDTPWLATLPAEVIPADSQYIPCSGWVSGGSPQWGRQLMLQIDGGTGRVGLQNFSGVTVTCGVVNVVFPLT